MPLRPRFAIFFAHRKEQKNRTIITEKQRNGDGFPSPFCNALFTFCGGFAVGLQRDFAVIFVALILFFRPFCGVVLRRVSCGFLAVSGVVLRRVSCGSPCLCGRFSHRFGGGGQRRFGLISLPCFRAGFLPRLGVISHRFGLISLSRFRADFRATLWRIIPCRWSR